MTDAEKIRLIAHMIIQCQERLFSEGETLFAIQCILDKPTKEKKQ